MSVEEFLRFKMCRFLRATRDDMEPMLRDHNEKGRIFALRDQNGRVMRIGISQGHSGEAAAQIDDEQLFVETPASSLWKNCKNASWFSDEGFDL